MSKLNNIYFELFSRNSTDFLFRANSSEFLLLNCFFCCVYWWTFCELTINKQIWSIFLFSDLSWCAESIFSIHVNTFATDLFLQLFKTGIGGGFCDKKCLSFESIDYWNLDLWGLFSHRIRQSSQPATLSGERWLRTTHEMGLCHKLPSGVFVWL